MSKKKIVLIVISVIILLFFAVFSGLIINQMIENDKKWEKIEENASKKWCTNLRDLACLKHNQQIINEDTEICKKVLASHTSYRLEDVEKCRSVLNR